MIFLLAAWSGTAAAGSVTTYDWDISDWAFVNFCHDEGVRPYEGETIRAVVKYDADGSIHLRIGQGRPSLTQQELIYMVPTRSTSTTLVWHQQ